MEFRESELRKIIREELDGKKNPLAQSNDPRQLATTQLSPSKEDSEVRLKAFNPGPAETGPLDLSSVIDMVEDLTEQVSILLMNSTRSPEHEWINLEVPNRISNKIMKAIRLEVDHITRELEMEDHDEW